MIDVATLSVIRRWALREQLSIREISRRTGPSRNTIRKYLRADAAEPRYSKRVSPSKLDPLALKLSVWLKTEIIPPRARKVVLGLFVDDLTPRLPREFKEKMRMHLYYLKRDDIGPARHAKKREFTAVASLRNVLYGLAAFATQIEPTYGSSIRKDLDAIAWPT